MEENACYTYALKLLNYKSFFTEELDKKLKLKKFSKKEREAAILKIQSFGYLDDVENAKRFIQGQFRKDFGPRSIVYKLKLKTGFSFETCEDWVQRELSDQEILNKLTHIMEKKFRALDPIVAKGKAYTYFVQRGFSHDVVADFIESQL
ncbi:MAG: RecX family transcriptional regulator [Simkaniaceae bacterium]